VLAYYLTKYGKSTDLQYYTLSTEKRPFFNE